MNKITRKKSLLKIWQQVPPNYYQQSIAGNLLQKMWHQQKVKKLSQIFIRHKYKKILDLGCAGGWMTNEIKELSPGSQIYGVDIYDKAIETAKKLYPQIIFRCINAHQLPFPNNYFNLITCYETIEHVAKPEVVLGQMRRVLKKKGKIIIAMDSGNLLFKVIWFVWKKTKGKVWQGAHLHPFDHRQLEVLIKKSQLNVLKKYFTHAGLEVVFELTKL